MQRGRILIVFILLFSYSFGFAHNIIPHCDTDHAESNCFKYAHELTENHDGHHQHTKGEEQLLEHSHIAHSNHFDDNLIEYVKCLFESPSHGHDFCSMDNQEHTVGEKESKQIDIKFIAVVCTLFNIQLTQNLSSEIQSEIPQFLRQNDLENEPLRGPPMA